MFTTGFVYNIIDTDLSDAYGASGQQWVDMELDLFGEGFARVLQETDLKKEIEANKKKEEDSF